EFEHRAVEGLAHLSRALVEITERVDGTAENQGEPDSLCLDETGQIDDHLGKGGQVSSKSLEQTLELGNHEDKQNDRYYDGNREYRRRVKHGFLDLLLQCFSLFLVGGDLVEECFERTGLLTRLDEIDEQIVEIQRMLG